MLTNNSSIECSSIMPPNIHDILTKIDAVLSEANEQVCRISNFLMSQPMAKAEKEPSATDMFSHVTAIHEKAMTLHDKIADISQILGM